RCIFFFSSRRRHTRFSRDWSSDVCSSDLGGGVPRKRQHRLRIAVFFLAQDRGDMLVRLRRKQALPEHSQGANRKGPQCAGPGLRSEERRVGKECRSRWWAELTEKKRERAT